MFKGEFTRTYPAPIATEGEHLVTLGIPHLECKLGYEMLVFPITYENGETLKPDNFVLFSPPELATPKDIQSFNLRATAISDCFNLGDSFSDKYWPQWKGKIGKVIIGKDSNGFAIVKKFLPSQASVDRRATQNSLY